MTQTHDTQWLRDAIAAAKAAHPTLTLNVAFQGSTIDNPNATTGYALLSLIRVAEGERGQGIGRDVLAALCDAADRGNITLITTPTNDFGARRTRLTRFFQRVGFLRRGNGRVDYMGEAPAGTMVRRPKALAS